MSGPGIPAFHWRIGDFAYLQLGALMTTGGFGVHLMWGAVKAPREGYSRYRHSWLWTWCTFEGWVDFGWWGFFPIRPIWDHHWQRRWDAIAVSFPDRINSQSWMGRTPRQLIGFWLVSGRGINRFARQWRFR